MDNNEFTKMLLLPPATYERLKNEILQDTVMSRFDQKMSQILKNKNLNDSDKWLMYRQELLRQNDLIRRHQDNFSSHENHIANIDPNKRRNFTYETKETQTKRPPKKVDQASQQEPPITMSDFSTQTNIFDLNESFGGEGEQISPENQPNKRRMSSGNAARALKPQKRKNKSPRTRQKDYELIQMVNGDIMTVPVEELEEFMEANGAEIVKFITKTPNKTPAKTPKKTPARSHYVTRSKGQPQLNFPFVKNPYKQGGGGVSIGNRRKIKWECLPY
jgi:hypothetical protein